jgi:tRNA A-37 threonylcarbamoyl transferase component Bud32
MAGCLRKASYIQRESMTRRAFLDREIPGELRERLWSDPESLLWQGEMMRRTGQRRTVRLQWGNAQYVLKHYRPTWWHFARQLPIRSWAVDTFRATIRLINAGIATPRPVACVENRWGQLRRDSFLMYEYVEGTTLRSYLQDDDSPSLADHLSQQLGDIWQRLEALRASLDDTHTGNFIVCPAGQLWVIDLDNARFHRSNYIAARKQQRGWEQFLRSAAKCGTTDVQYVRVKKPARRQSAATR